MQMINVYTLQITDKQNKVVLHHYYNRKRDFPDNETIPIVARLAYQPELIYKGFMSKTKPTTNWESINHLTPYIAYLMPNLSKRINEQSYLTTSLYYRLNDKIYPRYFYREPNVINTFISNSNETQRAYEYNPERGKKLIYHIRFKTESVTVGYSTSYLKKTAGQFSDILAQDKFKVQITEDILNSDVYIDFAPFLKSNPIKTFEWIVNRLESVDIMYESDREAVDIIKKHIESYYTTDRVESKEYYLKLIDYSLKYDLGIFPLFRPHYYLSYKENLYKPKFTDDGLLDLYSLQLLSFPQESDSL